MVVNAILNENVTNNKHITINVTHIPFIYVSYSGISKFSQFIFDGSSGYLNFKIYLPRNKYFLFTALFKHKLHITLNTVDAENILNYLITFFLIPNESNIT